MAKSSVPLTTAERIEKAFEDLEKATALAFDNKQVSVDSEGTVTEIDKPDLQALSRLIELAFKANGVLTADGKNKPNLDQPVAVPLDELERIVKAAKKLQGKHGSKED